MENIYYIGGGNGVSMIDKTLHEMGWTRTKDKTDENYRLRWCESTSAINYATFREGKQMVNHIPNCSLITNKLGLLTSLQEHERARSGGSGQLSGSGPSFMPETYRLDQLEDLNAFFDNFKENEMWICKPTGRNQGKGIFIVRSAEEVRQTVKDHEELQKFNEEHDNEKPSKPINRIIQRYLATPLLLDSRKFDIRAYMLIASTSPYVVLYHKGYVRLSMYEYSTETDNLIAHLTNQFIQKKDPSYAEVKEETAWSMERLNKYINEKVAPEKALEKNWVHNTLTNQMKKIMFYCFSAVKNKLECKLGYFDLYGFDFMIDQDMKVWLIECNINPCLATNCEALKEVVPGVVRETLHLAIECFAKARKGRSLLPLQSQKNFQLLYSTKAALNGTVEATHGQDLTEIGAPSTRETRIHTSHAATRRLRSSNVSPPRRARSVSPAKESRSHSPPKVATVTGTNTGATGNKERSTLQGGGDAAPRPAARRSLLRATTTLVSAPDVAVPRRTGAGAKKTNSSKKYIQQPPADGEASDNTSSKQATSKANPSRRERNTPVKQTSQKATNKKEGSGKLKSSLQDNFTKLKLLPSSDGFIAEEESAGVDDNPDFKAGEIIQADVERFEKEETGSNRCS